MGKFKKVAKVIGIIVIILLSVSVSVCLFVIPTETKAFFRELYVILNKPLPIAGISAVTFAVALIKIFSMSSWGKKRIAQVEAEHNKWKREVEDEKSREEELVKENKETKAEAEKMLQSFGGSIDGLVNILYEALMTSPNLKVQALAPRLKDLFPLTLEKAQKEVEEEEREKKSHEEDTEASLENMGLGSSESDKESVQNG